MGHVEAGETHQLAQYLSGLVQSLAHGGAELAVIPAVTPHICIEEVAAASPVPLVSILHAINEDLRAKAARRITLFGTRFTIESDLFGALTGVDVVRPRANEIDEIHRVYAEYAVDGVANAGQRETLHRVADALFEREKIDAIVLAGTDLSAFYDDEPPEYPAIDASTAHIHAIMQAALDGGVPDPHGARI
jgi:aspartate racemase